MITLITGLRLPQILDVFSSVVRAFYLIAVGDVKTNSANRTEIASKINGLLKL